MNPFVRFILMILIAGSAVNLAIVLLANARGRHMQSEQISRDQQRFQKKLADVGFGGHLRRADLVVEAQTIDAHGQARESTLLVWQYGSNGSEDPDSVGTDETQPMRLQRVVIPGDSLTVDGMLLDFSETFAEDAPEYQLLRGTQLSLFGMVRGDQERPAAVGSDQEGPFSFLHHFSVPQLMRLRPGDDQPSSYESALWTYIWSRIPEPAPASKTYSDRGLTVRWFTATPLLVRREHTYTAYVSPQGITLEENAMPTIPGLLDTMLKEAQRRDALP